MGDTKNEILDAVKLLLGIKDNDKDDVLMLLIEDTVNSVLAYCRIDVLPRQIVSFIPTFTVKRYTANQNGGLNDFMTPKSRCTKSVKIHMKKRVKKHFWGVLCVIFSHMKMNSKTVYTV